MEDKQKGLVGELKQVAKKLGHSPTRREVPSLAKRCYKYLKSFNRAKEMACLETKNKRITHFPKRVFNIDKDLSTIIAYLTADGHLYKDLRGFYFSSKDKNPLKEIESLINKKFGLRGKYHEEEAYGKSVKYRVFNSIISRFLNDKGAPAGDKMLVPFSVPKWIKKNKELSKEYLKILFYCEGSKYKQSKNTQVIKINFNKSERLLENALAFMYSLKKLLRKFDIETTNIWISKGNKRKRDKVITKQINFHIKSNSVDKFIKKIGWLK